MVQLPASSWFSATVAEEPFSFETGVPATGFDRLASVASRSFRTSSWTGKWRASVRDSVPLVVDEQDQIVWVAGYAIDEEFRVTNPAESRANLET